MLQSIILLLCLKLKIETIPIKYRAVARSENPGWHVLLGGDNVPPPG